MCLGPARAGRPDEVLRKKMDRYVELVQTDGFYLEALDAELFSKVFDKFLCFVVDDPESPPEVKTSTSLWVSLLPEQMTIDEQPVERENSWCLVSTAADYDPENPARNHWCPGFFEEAVGKDDFYALTCLHHNENQQKLKRLKADIRKVEALQPVSPDHALLMESKKMDLELNLKKCLCWFKCKAR